MNEAGAEEFCWLLDFLGNFHFHKPNPAEWVGNKANGKCFKSRSKHCWRTVGNNIYFTQKIIKFSS